MIPKLKILVFHLTLMMRFRDAGMISKFSNLDINVLICSNASIGAPELFSKSLIKIRAETLKSHKFLKIKKTFS